MSPTGHFAAGLAAKHFAPEVSLLLLMAASETQDILSAVFCAVGIDRPDYFPWSHSLFTSILFSLAWTIAVTLAVKKIGAGAVTGLVVFSHWLLDFLVWNNLILFPGLPANVGIGVFHAIGFNPFHMQPGLPLYLSMAIESCLLYPAIFFCVWSYGKGKKARLAETAMQKA